MTVLPSGVAGAYLKKRSRSFIFINAADFPTRQRFTLAHELGHHRIGHAAHVESPDDIARETPVPRERQANHFAGELLVPRTALQQRLDEIGNAPLSLPYIVRLAVDFGISPPAMLYRIGAAGLEVPKPVLRRLWADVQCGRHRPFAARFGRDAAGDQLSRLYAQASWPRLPAELSSNPRAHGRCLGRKHRRVGNAARDRTRRAPRMTARNDLIDVDGRDAAEPDPTTPAQSRRVADPRARARGRRLRRAR